MMQGLAANVSPYLRQAMVTEWEPPARPHCSNCLHAKVGGSPAEPMVQCAKGHGKPLPLTVVIRRKHPRQFTPAVDCADYDGMGGLDARPG